MSAPAISLAEQLDTLLLDRLATPCPSTARTVATVATPALTEVEAFCARFGLCVDRLSDGARWTSIRVTGPAHVISGFNLLARTRRGVPFLSPWA